MIHPIEALRTIFPGEIVAAEPLPVLRLQALRTLAPYFYLTSSQLRESGAPSWAHPESLEEQPGFFFEGNGYDPIICIYIYL